MSVWILTNQAGKQLYFGNKAALLLHIRTVIGSNYEDIHDGIHSTPGGAPFWTKEAELIT